MARIIVTPARGRTRTFRKFETFKRFAARRRGWTARFIRK
jgi:hypothetical protein